MRETFSILFLNRKLQASIVSKFFFLFLSNDFPKEFSNYTVSDGRVTFTVENEFSVTLTLFGVETSLPWRLLDIRFLIADDAVGEGMS